MAKSKIDKKQSKTDKPREPEVVLTVTPDHQVAMTRWRPDGGQIAAAGYDASVRRWDFSSEPPRELPKLKGHRGWVTGVAYVSNEVLISCDSWGQLTCWSLAGDAPKARWSQEQAHDGWIRDLAISADGKRIATCGRDMTVAIHDVDTGKRLHAWQLDEDLLATVWSPDGEAVLFGDMHGRVFVQPLKNDKPAGPKLTFEKMHTLSRLQDVWGLRVLRFVDDGKTLLVAGSEPARGGRMVGTPTVHELDWPTCKVKATRQFGAEKDGYVFDVTQAEHDGKDVLLIASSGTVGTGRFVILDRADSAVLWETTKLSNLHSVALHPDGRRVLIAGTNKRSGGNGRRLDKDGKYPGNDSPIHLLTLHPST